MEKDFYIMVINSCFRASREISETARMVKEFLPETEGDEVKMNMVLALAEIGKISDHIYKLHPDLEVYVEERIDKYGKIS